MVSLINFIRAHKRDHCNLQFVNLSVKNISHIYGAALDALHLTILTSYLCMVPHSFLSQIIWWLHIRLRVLVPEPQYAEQGAQRDQGERPPSTKT